MNDFNKSENDEGENKKLDGRQRKEERMTRTIILLPLLNYDCRRAAC